jgi:light-regulated signal transduction histidine kinase (bacteriophytochrome)
MKEDHANVRAENDAASNCELEKLNLSGAIQAFGALIGFDAATGCITHCSANLSALTGLPLKPAQEILGTSIFDIGLITPSHLSQLPSELYSTVVVARLPFSDLLSATLIRNSSSVVLEIELQTGSAIPIALHQLTGQFLEVPDSVDDVCASQKALLQGFRQIIDFDRIMIYKFHDDWSGEVVAEETATESKAYLGLHFPASDIPAIARLLYTINPSRLIPDTSILNVPIFSFNASPPDLTRSELRSVSPQHLQYLANMGVQSSFSVSLMMGKVLWGLVACHNTTARHLSLEQRNACIHLTKAHMLGVTSYLAGRRVQLVDSLSRDIDKVLKILFIANDPLASLESQSDRIMDWLSAQGFAMSIDDDVVAVGICPDFNALSLIDDWLVVDQDSATVYSDHLVDIFGKSSAVMELLSVVAGLFAIKIYSPRWGWIRMYWFRQEEPREVSWAGEPTKVVSGAPGREVLSPRKSFAKWVEKKSGYSRPWSSEDLLVGAKFRSALSRWI